MGPWDAVLYVAAGVAFVMLVCYVAGLLRGSKARPGRLERGSGLDAAARRFVRGEISERELMEVRRRVLGA